MLRIVLYFALLALPLLGTARLSLFILNHAVFGRKHEHSLNDAFLFAAAPAVVFLTFLFVPFINGVDTRIITAWGVAGGLWSLVMTFVGLYWIVDRLRAMRPKRVTGVTTHPSRDILLRRGLMPYASLRRLGAHNAVYDLELTFHDIYIDRLPRSFDGYRIAFLSDTHVASFMRQELYRRAVASTVEERADLVLFGGDFVTWRRHIPLMSRVLTEGLSAADGAYAVLGNHDYWAGAELVEKLLSERGVRFLRNGSVRIWRQADEINLVGIDEVYRGEPDVRSAFADIDPSLPTVVISHHPDIIDEFDDQVVDLMLCGHTHGGQIRFPFFGPVVVPSKHEGRYAAGFFRKKNVLMYVGRGIGSVPPLRILARPEVAFFTLRRNSRA